MMCKPEMLGWYYIAGGYQIRYPVEGIWDCTYLEYAKDDFRQGTHTRHLLNAVSNAKRALHYQVEALAIAFGWQKAKGKNNFPSKLEFLGRFGVTAPNIMRRVNKFRNTIEHDYYIPSHDEAEEYLDIVELYLLATHKVATDFPDGPRAELMSEFEEYNPAWGYPPSLDIRFPEGEGVLKVLHGSNTIVDLDIEHPEYFDWVRALVQQSVA